MLPYCIYNWTKLSKNIKALLGRVSHVYSGIWFSTWLLFVYKNLLFTFLQYIPKYRNVLMVQKLELGFLVEIHFGSPESKKVNFTKCLLVFLAIRLYAELKRNTWLSLTKFTLKCLLCRNILGGSECLKKKTTFWRKKNTRKFTF